jgi:predicted negative regulator of RcsB-dependent stress response
MMELREVILLAGGMSLGFGLGLLVYAVHRIREERNVRWLRKSGKRYETIINKIDRQEEKVRQTVGKLETLKKEYDRAI